MAEFINMRLTDLAMQDLNLSVFTVSIAFKGMHLTSSAFEYDDLPAMLQSRQLEPLVLVTVDRDDFCKVNQIAVESKFLNEDKKVLILWAQNSDKPESSTIPIVSLHQIDDSKKKLDWQALCELAEQPERAPQRKPPLWKRILHIS